MGMRKILNTLAVIAVLGGAFVIGRTVTRDSNGPATGETTQSTVDPAQSSAPSSASTTPINEKTGLPEVVNDLTKPADWLALGWLTDSLSRTHDVAAIAKARLGAYAHAAYHDAYREQGIDPIIAGTIGGATEEEALLAGAIVYARMLGDVAYATTADQWYDSLGSVSRDVVDAVLAAAKIDGYDSAADIQAPKFTGELAWQPSTELTAGTWGQGLLPGAGLVKTIALDTDRCRVPDAPVDSILKEKADIKTINNDPELDDFRRRATLQSAGGEPSSDIAFYLGETTPKLMVKFKNHQPLDAEMSTYLKTIVYSYDMLIVAFKAKWTNGIASPFEIAGAGNGLGLAAPSYPSVPSATMAFIQAFLEESRGQVLTYEEIESSTKRVEGIQAYNKTLAERVIHWEADIQAGQALGQCVVTALLDS